MSDIQKKVGTASRTGSTVGAGRADTAGHAWVLALTSLGFFMAMMDSMIVTTASTAIREDFDASVGQLQWTLNAYNVAVEAFLLIGVAIGGRIGHRRLYTIGLLLFVIGSGGSPTPRPAGDCRTPLIPSSSSPPREESSGHCPRASSQPAAPARWSSARSASRWDPCSCFGSESRPHR